jgi:hypothetical protein
MQSPVVGRDELVCSIVDHVTALRTLPTGDLQDVNLFPVLPTESSRGRCEANRDVNDEMGKIDEAALNNKDGADDNLAKNKYDDTDQLAEKLNLGDRCHENENDRNKNSQLGDDLLHHCSSNAGSHDGEKGAQDSRMGRNETSDKSKNILHVDEATHCQASPERQFILVDLNKKSEFSLSRDQTVPDIAPLLPIFLHGIDGSGKSSVLALICSVLRDPSFIFNNNNNNDVASPPHATIPCFDGNHMNCVVIFHSVKYVDGLIGFGGYNSCRGSEASVSHSRLCPMSATTEEISREALTLGLATERSAKQLGYLQLRLCLEIGNEWVRDAVHDEMVKCVGNHQQTGKDDVRIVDTDDLLTILLCCEERQRDISRIYEEMMNKQLFRCCGDVENSQTPSTQTLTIIVIDDFEGLLDGLDLNSFVFPKPLPKYFRVIATLSSYAIQANRVLERFFVEETPSPSASVTASIPVLRDADNLLSTPSVLPKQSSLSVVQIPSLSDKFRERMVHNYLRTYNKQLEPLQMRSFLRNPGCESLTWLSFACESILVFGAFDAVADYISSLPTDVNGLMLQFLQRIMVIINMYIVRFSCLNQDIEEETKMTSTISDDRSCCSVVDKSGARSSPEEPSSTSISLAQLVSSMIRYILLSRFSSLEESEVRELCGRHVCYSFLNSVGVSGDEVSHGGALLQNVWICSNADWSAACFYLRPFFQFKVSRGSNLGATVVTVRSAAVSEMLQQYFNISSLYYSEVSTDADEILHRRHIASYCSDTRLSNAARYWSEYAYQLLKVRDLPRLGHFCRTEDLLRSSRFIRQKVLDICRCSMRLHGVPQDKLLRENMCHGCSMKTVVTVRGTSLRRDSCCMCAARIFTPLQMVSTPGKSCSSYLFVWKI